MALFEVEKTKYICNRNLMAQESKLTNARNQGNVNLIGLCMYAFEYMYNRMLGSGYITKSYKNSNPIQ